MPQEIFERLRALDVSSLADADKTMRVMSGPVRVSPGRTLLGTAFTVRCTSDLFAVLDGLEAAQPGDVLVVDTRDSPRAVCGELIATEAERKGLAGIVVDGLCRDVAGLRRLSLPFYARGSRPDAGGAAVVDELQRPLHCGGVEVRPGEVVFGDDDGVLVASTEQVLRALPAAEEIQRREEAILEHMRRGGSLFDHLDLSPVREGTGPIVWR
jgi:4-hydroxy-4-methyl-2-oxoglutarate aldolase